MANLWSRVGGRLENKCLDIWEDALRPQWKALPARLRRLRGVMKSKPEPKVLEEGGSTASAAATIASDNESVFVRTRRTVGYSLAAAAMLPAIFVQVPSGLAVSGSLVSGIASANQITGNATNGSAVVNVTTLQFNPDCLNSIALNVGYSFLQVAIGITVGLFLIAIVVYPLGKRRSGLFSF